MDEAHIYQQLFSLVHSLFQGHPLQNYYGAHLSMKVLKHVNDCIVMESHKKQRDTFLLRCSAILCSLPLFFSIKDIRKWLRAIFPKKNSRLIQDISHVICLAHSAPSKKLEDPWKLFVRYCFLLEHLGMEGGLRAYYHERYRSGLLELSSSFREDYRKKTKKITRELEKSNIPCIMSICRERNKQMQSIFNSSLFLEIEYPKEK